MTISLGFLLFLSLFVNSHFIAIIVAIIIVVYFVSIFKLFLTHRLCLFPIHVPILLGVDGGVSKQLCGS